MNGGNYQQEIEAAQAAHQKIEEEEEKLFNSLIEGTESTRTRKSSRAAIGVRSTSSRSARPTLT
jgi:hypothetical protein